MPLKTCGTAHRSQRLLRDGLAAGVPPMPDWPRGSFEGGLVPRRHGAFAHLRGNFAKNNSITDYAQQFEWLSNHRHAEAVVD
jgi:hypothetical protein